MPVLNLAPLLSPQSIAVVGASDDISILRGRTLRVLLSHPYQGRVYPVSRSLAHIQGRKAYKSVEELPERVDLALLIIPAEFVVEELERCGRAGIRAALIITSGFAEQSGTEGAALQARLRAIGNRYGMIVCGPNTEGFANLTQSLCATFSPAVDGLKVPLIPNSKHGRVAVIAQSGGMGFSFFDRGRPKEISFSYIVTTGNEACLEVFDVVDYLIDENSTDVFLLFLENIKSAETFRRAADKALRAGKPLIVVKVGRSDAGQRAAASHTAAMAGAYDAYRTMFEQFGIIEGDDLEQMVDLAAAFTLYRDRLPLGLNVGIGTASGGGGGWLADACYDAGLTVPELDPETRSLIDKHLPAYGTSQNPVDGTAQAIRQIGYSELARLIALSSRVDSVAMVISARSSETLEREHENLQKVARETQKPIFMWSYTQPSGAAVQLLSEAGFPLFTSMRNCTRAISEMARYRSHRERYAALPTLGHRADADRLARVRLAILPKVLCEYQIAPILREYGIEVTPAHLSKSSEEAIRIAREMQSLVALKVQSPNLLHKTEAGAVALDVREPDVKAQFQNVVQNAQRHIDPTSIHGVLVQKMATKGIEMILSVRRDPLFGPMLLIGLGGVGVEVMKDVAMAPAPLTAEQAGRLLEKLKCRPLLAGIRGAPPADVPALIELMVRVAQLADELRDDMDEFELNPVIVHQRGKGVSIVDALWVSREVSPLIAKSL